MSCVQCGSHSFHEITCGEHPDAIVPTDRQDTITRICGVQAALLMGKRHGQFTSEYFAENPKIGERYEALEVQLKELVRQERIDAFAERV